MLKVMGHKLGDTLIEVTMAIGIFSLVAVAIVAILNTGTSGAQSSLETTLTREEIDTQAEAIRFIQAAYFAEIDSTDESTIYGGLWDSIISLSANSYNDVKEIVYGAPNTAYGTPNTCQDLYSSPAFENYAFVIDPSTLGGTMDKFSTTTTYPRLIYSNSDDVLISEGFGTGLSQAEGLYVVAVRGDTVDESNRATFYDFYIRGCWYNVDSDTPSVIATVIRLNDPLTSSQAAATGGSYGSYGNSGSANFDGGYSGQSVAKNFWVTYYNNGGSSNKETSVYSGGEVIAVKGATSIAGYSFEGWSTSSGGSVVYKPGDQITVNKDYNLYAKYAPFKITYNANGGSYAPTTHDCPDTCNLSTSKPSRSGYQFLGWSTSSTASSASYSPGDSITISSSTTLYAVWRARNETITITLTWTYNIDYDSYIYGTKADGSSYEAYYNNMSPTETVNGVTRVLASLNRDCTGSCRSETFTINTLGGRNYYYYVRNYTSNSNVTDAKVVVSGDYIGSYTFESNGATGSGRIWNVFAYKDGQIVSRQQRSGSAQTSY